MFPQKTTIPNDNIILINPEDSITQSSGGTFSFGWIPPGGTSKTLISYIKIPEITGIGQLYIGLANTGGLTFRTNSFGCQTLPTLNPNHTPTTFFTGINNGFDKGNQHNILVNTRNSNESYYVYLNLNLTNSTFGWNGTIKYRWFIDYAN